MKIKVIILFPALLYQPKNMFYRLIKELAEKENVTEKLKAENAMLWLQRMNNIRNRAMEIVNADLIYA